MWNNRDQSAFSFSYQKYTIRKNQSISWWKLKNSYIHNWILRPSKNYSIIIRIFQIRISWVLEIRWSSSNHNIHSKFFKKIITPQWKTFQIMQIKIINHFRWIKYILSTNKLYYNLYIILIIIMILHLDLPTILIWLTIIYNLINNKINQVFIYLLLTYYSLF